VRKKRPRGVQEEAQGVQVSPLNPLSVAPRTAPAPTAVPTELAISLAALAHARQEANAIASATLASPSHGRVCH
jgi:hypothetical protein